MIAPASLAQSAAALQERLRAAYPRVDTAVIRDFVDQLRSATGLTVDPEHTYLDEFTTSRWRDGHWSYPAKPIRSTSLANLVRQGFPTDIDWEHTEMNARAAVVRRGPTGVSGTTAGSGLNIDVAHLKNIVDGMGSPSRSYLTQLGQFWGNDDPFHPGLQLQSLLNSAHAYQSAHTQHEAGQLSATAMGMIRQAAGFPESAPLAMNSYALDIGGYRANDIVVMQGDDGRTVMYQPGAELPFKEFQRADDLRVAIKDLVVDPQARARLASHFSLDDRRDSFKAGVDSLLEMLARTGNRAGVPILVDKAQISGDVFDWMAREQRRSSLAEATALLGSDLKGDTASYLDSRVQQLFQAPAVAFAMRDMEERQIGQDAWRDALNVALSSNQAPSWVRQSALTPPALTGMRALPRESQRNIALRHFILTDAQQTLASHEPDLQGNASSFMSRKLRQEFGFTHDIGKYALVSFHNDFVKPAIEAGVGMPYTPLQRIPHPLAGRVQEIVPLSRIPISSVPYIPLQDEGTDPDKVHARYAVLKIDAIPKHWDDVVSTALPVKPLVELVRDNTRFDFESEMLASIDLFYHAHNGDLSALAAQKALLAADVMRAEGKLAAADHELAVAGFGFSPATPARQGDAGQRISTHAVNLFGHVSYNAMRVTDHATGRTLLYLPQSREPIKAFASNGEAVSWLLRLRKDAQATQRFVANHFSAGDAEQVLAMLNYRRRFSPTFRRHILTGAVDLTGRPFRQLATIEQQQLKADIKEHIASAGDIRTNYWLNALDATPLPYLPAMVKAIVGPTSEQRRKGLQELGMEGLMDIFTLGLAKAGSAGLTGHNSLWKTVRREANKLKLAGGASLAAGNDLARWFKPPQRMNAKIGYPLSPNPGNQSGAIYKDVMAAASKYDVVNPEIRRVGNPYYHWNSLGPSSKTLFEKQHAQLYQDAQAFFQQNSFPERPPRPYPSISQEWMDGTSPHRYPPLNPEFSDQVLHKALSNKDSLLSNGIIFGEDHTTSAARTAMVNYLDKLDARGVKTLYVEALLRDDSPGELRNFNLTGEVSRKLRAQLAKRNADEAMLELMMRAHDKGMKIVALDSLAAWQKPGTAHNGEVRMTTMNYSALNIIRAEQMANGFRPWAALVGSNHGQRTYGVPGINELTGAISVFIGHASGPHGLAKNGLDFSLAIPLPRSDR